jgi:hypothetical protein
VGVGAASLPAASLFFKKEPLVASIIPSQIAAFFCRHGAEDVVPKAAGDAEISIFGAEVMQRVHTFPGVQ